MADGEPMENFYLFDEKEFYLQVVDAAVTFESVNDLNPQNAYYIFIREFNQETWQYGPIYEIKIDKNITASKFGQFLSEKVFPHIPSDCLFASKVVVGKSFKRGDLVFRKWSKPKV